MTSLITLPHGDALSIRAKALVFHDPRSLDLLAQVERIAPTEATALIIGETGTGKELLARHIHNHSKRQGPFIAINCGAFSETLVDAELFGHESGAFTGANRERQGWFEAANGGTLFLDEIGDLPLSMQVKLLRVLQERQVVRIGSRRPIPINVRLIAATNIDLADAVEAGRFRVDLFFRLSVATLDLLPLCARPGDILPLARHFLRVYAQRLNHASASLSADAALILEQYEWPGNIRELENAIHFALIASRDGVVRPEDLRVIRRPLLRRQRPDMPSGLWSGRSASPPESTSAPRDGGVTRNDQEDIEQLRERFIALFDQGRADLHERIESTLVSSAYAFCHNNQVQAARLLGISRNVLRTLLKRHGLLKVERDDGDEVDDDFDLASNA